MEKTTSVYLKEYVRLYFIIAHELLKYFNKMGIIGKLCQKIFCPPSNCLKSIGGLENIKLLKIKYFLRALTMLKDF